MFAGYSYNERSMLSLGVVDSDVEIGTEVVGVGRTEWRHAKNHGRAAQTNRHSRHGQPRPYSKSYAKPMRRAGERIDRLPVTRGLCLCC